MEKFELTFLDDETGMPYKEEHEFEDTGEITAKMWAEDYCYMRADKGYYKIKDIK